MATLEESLRRRLDDRRRRGLLRTVDIDSTLNDHPLIDFSSSDYLGLSRDESLCRRTDALMSEYTSHARTMSMGRPVSVVPISGSTGSRLLAGNSVHAKRLESHLCAHYDAPSALLFNSGYDANIAVFSSVPQPGDLVLCDELVHASVHDGLSMLRRIRRSASSSPPCRIDMFKHNCIEDVVKKIDAFFGNGRESTPVTGHVIIAVEGVYSMDGDVAPLRDFVALGRRYPSKINIIVDEAHSTGIIGECGTGLARHLGVSDAMFLRLHTFGKAMGIHGAVVLGSTTLTSYLSNYGRPVVYSTMMSFHSLAAIRASHDLVAVEWRRLQCVMETNVALFRERMGDGMRYISSAQGGDGHDGDCDGFDGMRVWMLDSTTPIQGLVIPGNSRVMSISSRLRERGFAVLPVRAPSVPQGAERLRICVHAHNTKHEIVSFVNECVRAIVEMVQRERGDFVDKMEKTIVGGTGQGVAVMLKPRL